MDDTQKNVIIVLNTFIKSQRTLLRKSVESVAWIKEVDITEKNLEYVFDGIRNAARWLKKHKASARVEILYVFDAEVLDLVAGQRFPELLEVREIVREKAVEDGERFLGMLKGMLAAEGLSATTKLRVGEPAAEIEKEAAEFGASLLIVGESSKKIKEKLSFPVIKFGTREFRILDRLKAKTTIDTAPSN